MNLHDWLRNGWLIEHATSSEEIDDLFGAADRDLTDCKVSGLSPDWRLHIAYNAALLLATVALAEKKTILNYFQIDLKPNVRCYVYGF